MGARAETASHSHRPATSRTAVEHYDVHEAQEPDLNTLIY